MSGFVSFGYLQPLPSRVSCGQLLVSAGGLLAAAGRVSDWHYLTDVTIEWPISIDLHGLRQDCGFSENCDIGVALSWRSDRTNLRATPIVKMASNGENRLGTVIPGPVLGGTLTIEASLVLRRIDAAAQQFAAPRPGSLLWQHSERIALEGAGGRFPITYTNFTAAGLPSGDAGMWYLDISDANLQASCTAALTLYVNSANASIKEIVQGLESARGSSLVRFMRYDVYRQLMGIALRNEEFDDRAIYEQGSLGDMLVTLLRLFFPERNIDQLRRDFSDSAAEVEAELLAGTWRQVP